MNCNLCKKKLDGYHEGILPDGIRIQVESHLAQCKACNESYRLITLFDKVLEVEKEVQSNLFLPSRIMASIEELELSGTRHQNIPVYQKVLKPVLIGFSIAAAMFIGILGGNVYKPSHPENKAPVEMSYMNDDALESVTMFSND